MVEDEIVDEMVRGEMVDDEMVRWYMR